MGGWVGRRCDAQVTWEFGVLCQSRSIVLSSQHLNSRPVFAAQSHFNFGLYSLSIL